VLLRGLSRLSDRLKFWNRLRPRKFHTPPPPPWRLGKGILEGPYSICIWLCLCVCQMIESGEWGAGGYLYGCVSLIVDVQTTVKYDIGTKRTCLNTLFFSLGGTGRAWIAPMHLLVLKNTIICIGTVAKTGLFKFYFYKYWWLPWLSFN
jgi:hypothetical protein